MDAPMQQRDLGFSTARSIAEPCALDEALIQLLHVCFRSRFFVSIGPSSLRPRTTNAINHIALTYLVIVFAFSLFDIAFHA